jgi:hypothetical protein
LERNPQIYRAAGLPPFGDTYLGRQLEKCGSSPLATQILEGTSRHEDKTISAIADQLGIKTDIPPMPPPTVKKQTFTKLSAASAKHHPALSQDFTTPFINVLHKKRKKTLHT